MNYSQYELLEKMKTTLSLDDIQKYINQIIVLRGWGNQSSIDKMLLLTEEVGELAKAVRKTATSISIDRNKIQNYDTVENEIADVFIVLLTLCDVLNINLFSAFIEKEKENINREWEN